MDQVIDGLRFLGAHQRSVPKRGAVADLSRYLTTNRERMRYATFQAHGYHIGSGAVESAVSCVVQQRMKRVGMRWRAAGADAMLLLRCVYRSTGLWDQSQNKRVCGSADDVNRDAIAEQISTFGTMSG